MNYRRILLCLCLIPGVFSTLAFGQVTGDFRSHQTGNWDTLSTWEQYNGATWVWPAPAIPDTLHATTIRSGDSVFVKDTVKTYVGASTVEAGAKLAVIGDGDTTLNLIIANGTMLVRGTLVQTGAPAANSPYAIVVTSTGTLEFATGGILQQDQNGGQIPTATWDDGSTLLVTGITSSTNMGGSPGVSYYNIIWNCPGQTANANMGMHPGSGSFDTTTTIRGDLTLLSTGLSRAYLCGPNAGVDTQHQIIRVNILGRINVLNGAIFSSNGTSKAYTDIIITVLGNITVKDSVFLTASSTWQFSQLSISRGTQGGTGTSTWFIKSDSVIYGRKTTNSNSTEGSPPPAIPTKKGKFVFCKPGTQIVRLDDSVNWTGPCNMQFGDSIIVTTIDAGNSPFIGSGCIQRIKHNATVILDTSGYIGGGTNSSGGRSNFAMDSGATLVIGSENGIRATHMGSSGAVRVDSTRDYGTASNFVYTGVKNQRLGSGFPASASNLTINNPLGVYIDSVPGFTINTALTVQSGDLNLNGATITLGPNASLSETPGNTVKGTSGMITTTRSLHAPSLSTNIAGLGIAIGSSADLGSTVISRGHSVQGGSSILRYFDITPTNNAGLNASLNFFYDNSELNFQDPPTLQLRQSTDGGASWSLVANTVDTSLHRISATGLASLWRYTLADSAHPIGGTTFTYSMSDGWNMISLGMKVANPRQEVLFPVVASRAFAYSGGYIPVDTLKLGSGYWLKFTGPQSPSIYGVPVTADSIDVLSGWNMIGSIGSPVSVGDVQSVPPALSLSPFFGYNGGYFVTDSIRPGVGYWVRVPQNAILILSTSVMAQNRVHIVPTGELPPSPPTATGEQPSLRIPKEYNLGQNYPNPFNPSTTLEIAVPRASQVRVAVYNILGERVATLVDGMQPAGYHTVVWNGMTDNFTQASSGVYMIRMSSGSFTAIRKILMMK